MSSHPIIHLTNSKEPLFHFTFQCSHFYLLSFQLSISYWPADCTQNKYEASLFVFLSSFSFSWMFGIHHKRSPRVSSDFSLLPLLLSLLPFPALQKTVRKVRGVESHFFLLHLLQSDSCSSFHSHGSISTVLHLSSFLFFFNLNFSLISSQTFGSIYFLLLLQCLTARPSCLLFNSTVPSCCPLRCFPNFWRLSGAAWLGPSLFFLHSLQERHWDSELCLLSTTTTRRLNSCWTTDGFPVKLTSNIKTYAVCWLLYYSFSLQWCWVLLLLTPGALSVDTLWPSPTGQDHLRISSLFKRLLI